MLCPPCGRFTLASLGITTTSPTSGTFTQAFFPQQLNVLMSVIPTDEIQCLVDDSMALPPIDLTLPANAYADLSIFALIPVPRTGFAALKASLPTLAPNPTVPQILSFRTPTQLLQLYQGAINYRSTDAESKRRLAERDRQSDIRLLYPRPQLPRLREFCHRDQLLNGDTICPQHPSPIA